MLVGLAGPAILLFGTEAQKKKFLPPLARSEQLWFQAFTEPDAGSDEANQQTRAIEDGDYYIINGHCDIS
jgi:alkylation response protein AidB-like acyl-CoA dehydrogenase